MKLDNKGLNQKIIERYNDLVVMNCYDHLTIGERLSEGTENWNLADVVYEIAYILDTYYEEGHVNHDSKYDDYKQYVSEVGKHKRFVKRFLPIVKELGLKPVEGHASSLERQVRD